MTNPDAFRNHLYRLMTQKDRFPAALSKFSGVSERTIENWAAGKSKPTRRGGLINLLKVIAVLSLQEQEADQLLILVPHPTIAALRDTARKSADQELLAVLAPWEAGGRLSSALHQLHAPTSDFVGRQRETEDLVNSLGQVSTKGAIAAISGVRGMAGIGKTELAYVVGQRLHDAFPDAQLVIDLQGSRDPLPPERVLQQIISAFFPEEKLPEDLTSLTARYRTVLTGKRVFILADDAHDAQQVLPLRPPAGSALLLTSRFRFDLPGMTTLDLDELSEAEAILLLQTINPALPKEIAEEIASLCGYLPLALLVVAGLTKKTTRSLNEYVALLRNERERLNRMADKRANLSVEASLSLSYKLLSPWEQHVLARLGVFAPSFDRKAIEAIIPTDEGVDLVDTLDSLFEANLLEYDAIQARYSLHELVRIFALARLRESNQEEPTYLQHAQYYIQIAEEAERQFLAGGAQIVAGLALFDRERVQIDAAWNWMIQHAGNSVVDSLLLMITDATAFIGDLRYPKRMIDSANRASARIPQLEAALGAARRLNNRHAQGTFLGNLGLAHADLSDARKAIDFYHQQLLITREVGDRRGESTALGNLGNEHIRLGDVHTAIDFYQQTLVITREIGDRQGEGNALGNLGLAYADLGDARRAIDFYHQQLLITREIGDRRGESAALGNLGSAYASLGDVHTAIDFYQQALVITREIGDRQGEGNALGNLGNAYFSLGDTHTAIDFYQQTLAIAREIGDRQGEAETSWNYGLTLIGEGGSSSALPLLEASLAFFQEIDHPRAAAMASTIAYIQQHGTLPSTTEYDDSFADLPEAVIEAIKRRDVAALQAALAALPAEEARAIIRRLEQAGIIGEPPQANMTQVLQRSAPLLRDIAAVAEGDEERKAQIEALLPQLEQQGWQLTTAVQRIWAGERDAVALTQDIDPNSAQLVQRILDMLTAPEPHAEEHDDLLSTLPEAVRTALEDSDPAVLQTALDALPSHERPQVEQTLLKIQERVIAQLAEVDPQEILASLPQAIRQALEQEDQQALDAAFEALPPEQQREVTVALAQIQAHARLHRRQEDPRERFAPLLRDIALIAAGDEQRRQVVENALEQLEQGGWMLREPVRRIWLGDRDAAVLTPDLDEQDSLLIERVLELVAEYERAERKTPAQVLLELPETVRQAIEQQDQEGFQAAVAALPAEEQERVLALLASIQGADDTDEQREEQPRPAMLAALPEAVRSALQRKDTVGLQQALAALPPDEAADIVQQLEQTGIIGSQRRPDVEQLIQNFLPLLGDVALATYGNTIARALVEAVLPQLEEQGWHLSAAIHRIWTGERDDTALTADLDEQDSLLVRRILSLIASGPDMIFVADSLQIVDLHRRANLALTQALADSDTTQRPALAEHFEDLAGQAAQQPGAPWQDLALDLRTYAAQLRAAE